MTFCVYVYVATYQHSADGESICRIIIIIIYLPTAVEFDIAMTVTFYLIAGMIININIWQH